jgi:hypothetical protein
MMKTIVMVNIFFDGSSKKIRCGVMKISASIPGFGNVRRQLSEETSETVYTQYMDIA